MQSKTPIYFHFLDPLVGNYLYFIINSIPISIQILLYNQMKKWRLSVGEREREREREVGIQEFAHMMPR